MRRRPSQLAVTLASVCLTAAFFPACGSSDAPAIPDDLDASSDAGTTIRNDSAVATVDGATRPPLPTGRFRVGVWCGLPVAQSTPEHMAEMASAGFTTTSYGCQGDVYTVAYNSQMVSLANAAGMDAIVTDKRIFDVMAGKDVTTNIAAITADYGKLPGLAGYYLTDEPSGPFTGLAAIVNGFQTSDPAHFAYVNLLPSYATTGQLGAATYDDYIADYITAAKPKVISYDHYPFHTDGESTSFIADLATMREHAVTANIPFWQFIQSVTFPGVRATTGAEKLWEGMQTLAFGGAGVSYFTYGTPTDAGFGTGLIDLDGKPTPAWFDVKANNARFGAFGRYLVAAKSTGVFHNGALPAGTTTRAAGAPVYLPNATPMTVGMFSVNGDAYAFLANFSHVDAVESDVFLASATPPEVLDVPSGKFVPIRALASDPVKGTKTHVSLPAGDGALFHLFGPVPPGAPGAEAFVGTVRNDSAMLDVVDSSFGDGTIGQEAWDMCPEGYAFAGRQFESNGFWLCTRKDLGAHTFYVGNVVADQAIVYAVKGGTSTAVGAEGWNTCPKGTLLGRRFESNGYWLCMD